MENLQRKMDVLITEMGKLSNNLDVLRQMLALDKKPGYTNKELLKLFDITYPTLKKWRDEGHLSYSQVGDKYYYSLEDIAKFLTKHHIESFR